MTYFNKLYSINTAFSIFNPQYVNKAATTMRGALKEPAKVKAMAQEKFTYNSAAWTAGEMGAKTEVSVLSQAGK